MEQIIIERALVVTNDKYFPKLLESSRASIVSLRREGRLLQPPYIFLGVEEEETSEDMNKTLKHVKEEYPEAEVIHKSVPVGFGEKWCWCDIKEERPRFPEGKGVSE